MRFGPSRGSGDFESQLTGDFFHRQSARSLQENQIARFQIRLQCCNEGRAFVESETTVRGEPFVDPAAYHFKCLIAQREKRVDPGGRVLTDFVVGLGLYRAQLEHISEDDQALEVAAGKTDFAESSAGAVDHHSAEAEKAVLESDGFVEWTQALSAAAPTEANPNRTLFAKHLTDYTARNTFDYFIHKDLGGFLGPVLHQEQ